MSRLLLAVPALVLVLTGCRTDAVAAEGVPALLRDPDAQTRADLQRVVSEALGGAEVLLSDDALTESSLLIIERRRHVDAAGRRVMGRDLSAPDRFLLIKQGERCLLEHQASGQRWPMVGAVCIREASAAPPPH